MDPRKREDSWEQLNDSMIVGSAPNETLQSTNSDNQDLYASVIVHKDEDSPADKEKKHHSYANIDFQPLNKDKPEVHSYANIAIGAGSLVAKPKSAPSSPKKPKKPIPIRRKQEVESEENTPLENTPLTSSQEITNSIESNSSPPSKMKVPKKPPPPVKPTRPSEPLSPLDDEYMLTASASPVVSTPPQGSIPVDKPFPLVPKKPNPHFEKRERSKTTLDSGSEKKQPLLPPFKPLRDMAKTTDNLPSLVETVTSQPEDTSTSHSALKPKLSEPAQSNIHTVKDSDRQPRASIESFQNRPQFSAELNRTKLHSGSIITDSAAQTGRNELMKKLSLRRQKLDEQLGAHKVSTTPKPIMDYISETSSERNSIVSTASTEVVVKYNTRDDPANGTVKTSGTDSDKVVLRPQTDNNSLAKFGIIEDTEGGSFVI